MSASKLVLFVGLIAGFRLWWPPLRAVLHEIARVGHPDAPSAPPAPDSSYTLPPVRTEAAPAAPPRRIRRRTFGQSRPFRGGFGRRGL